MDEYAESTISIDNNVTTIAKRADWSERQPPSVKTMFRMGNGITDEDYRPSLKKLVNDEFERYSEPFKSPNTKVK